MKAGVGPALVVRDHDADRPAAHDQRHEERRVHAEPAGGLLVDLRIVEHGVDALAAAALEHAARPSSRANSSSIPTTP